MRFFEIPMLYEEIISNGIDPDTGVLTDEAIEKLKALDDEADGKALNVAKLIKQSKFDLAALTEHKRDVDRRIRTEKNKIERLTALLEYYVPGKKLKDAEIALTWRNTTNVVDISDEDAYKAWAVDNFPSSLKYSEPEISKTAVKDALEEGQEIPFVQLVNKISPIIK